MSEFELTISILLGVAVGFWSITLFNIWKVLLDIATTYKVSRKS